MKLTFANSFNPSISRTKKSRSGFTLVELLVVIAIIGILVSLLLPAVQAAREAARRLQCANNSAQLGIAMHNFDFSYGVLPPGVVNPTGPIRYEPVGNHTSWTVQLLPYLEQNSLYNHYDAEAGVYAASNAKLSSLRVPTFNCPSNGVTYLTKDNGLKLYSSSYAGCHNSTEKPIDSDNDGVLFLNSRIPFASITDGTSNTILIGERYFKEDRLGWMSGTRDTLRNMSSINSQSRIVPNSPNSAVSADSIEGGGLAPLGSLVVGGFGSYHTGGAMFVFCDGSVQMLSTNTNAETLRQLGNKSDGELMEDFR